jgi:hypothetical protein
MQSDPWMGRVDLGGRSRCPPLEDLGCVPSFFREPPLDVEPGPGDDVIVAFTAHGAKAPFHVILGAKIARKTAIHEAAP